MQNRQLTQQECDDLAESLQLLYDHLGSKIRLCRDLFNMRNPLARSIVDEIKSDRTSTRNSYHRWLKSYGDNQLYQRYSEWVERMQNKWEKIVIY